MLDPKKMVKQMLDFYRSTFDNSFSAMMMLQEQMERLANLFFAQMVNVPEEVKKGLTEWSRNYRKACEDFKNMMDDNFKRLEALLGEGEKAGKAETTS